MNLLVTGGKGFLGKTIISYFPTNVCFDILARDKADICIDLSCEVPRFSANYDGVIHCAGISHIPQLNYRQQIHLYNDNVAITQNLLTGLTSMNNLNFFVFISSVSVYGKISGLNISEKDNLDAEDNYGRSKIIAEKLVIDWCKENNVICTILRLPLVVGVNAPGNLGAMINGIRKGFYFNIAGGSAKKSMVLATDVAKYILKSSQVGGIYNLTDGYHPSFFELSSNLASQLGKSRPKSLPYWLVNVIAIIGDLIGNKAPINSLKLAKITCNLTFDDNKARDAFGWNPTPVLEGFRININQ